MIDQHTHEYPVSVVAAIFFDQEPWWLRYHERNQRIREPRRTKKGHRTYTLDDVRDIALQLLAAGAIDRYGYHNCLARLASMDAAVFTRSKAK